MPVANSSSLGIRLAPGRVTGPDARSDVGPTCRENCVSIRDLQDPFISARSKPSLELAVGRIGHPHVSPSSRTTFVSPHRPNRKRILESNVYIRNTNHSYSKLLKMSASTREHVDGMAHRCAAPRDWNPRPPRRRSWRGTPPCPSDAESPEKESCEAAVGGGRESLSVDYVFNRTQENWLVRAPLLQDKPATSSTRRLTVRKARFPDAAGLLDSFAGENELQSKMIKIFTTSKAISENHTSIYYSYISMVYRSHSGSEA